MDKNARINAYLQVGKDLQIYEEPPLNLYFEFWQYLIDTGMAWSLEGSYGRTAASLLDDGYCVRENETLTEQVIELRQDQLAVWEFEQAMEEERLEAERIASQTFQTVVIDPPWNEQGGGKIKRGADRHYPLMKTPDIIRTILQIPQWNNIAENAHCYLWVTNNFLPAGLVVMSALGFKYKTNFVWVKPSMGLGQYFRGQHELCLFGTKGKKPTQPRTARKDLASVIKAEKGRHSAKPVSSYELIEARSEGAYMEIFARSNRPEWFCWGNEV